MLADYETHLRTSNNKRGRPFAEKSVRSYVKAARALDQWLTAGGTDQRSDFTVCDTATLNQFFRAYFDSHDQGGTAAQQRNMRALFSWLEDEYDHAHPWRDKRFHRYAAPTGVRPQTLSHEFIEDLLRVTGNGAPRIRDEARTRDHAIIRVLTEGLRAEELLSLRLDHLHLADGLLGPVTPLKEARASGEGRIIALQPKTVVAIQRYLRARDAHKRAGEPWLWLGLNNRPRLKYSGLYRMVRRRTEEANYTSVHPHQFRHTMVDDLLSGGVAEGDVMQMAGWKSREMLNRYAADMASTRAVSAVKRMGDRY
ncbi:site-specific integrase [Streptomyces sp. NPDC020766]|uniref:tyrosine-type recombinase/integrase n=1 Tax=Streptomyces sp. NPDC020766 TaxID=3155011 RepID=UPI0033F6A838